MKERGRLGWEEEWEEKPNFIDGDWRMDGWDERL